MKTKRQLMEENERLRRELLKYKGLYKAANHLIRAYRQYINGEQERRAKRWEGRSVFTSYTFNKGDEADG